MTKSGLSCDQRDARSSEEHGCGGEGPREAIGGGGEQEPNQILLQEPAYVPSSILKAKTLQ
jgi:hypothetical protein